jgi:hypothetical protein
VPSYSNAQLLADMVSLAGGKKPMTENTADATKVKHGGVIPFHTERREDCPWCREDALRSHMERGDRDA